MRLLGDIILLQGHGFMGDATNWFEALYNVDHSAKHNHAALMLTQDAVLETGAKGGNRTGITPWPDYAGHTIQAWRWKRMSTARHVSGLWKINSDVGRFYPFWRLLLFAVNLAGLIHWKNKVCSEFVACYLTGAGAMDHYWGVDPDDLHDLFAASPEWEMVYEGKARGWA